MAGRQALKHLPLDPAQVVGDGFHPGGEIYELLTKKNGQPDPLLLATNAIMLPRPSG